MQELEQRLRVYELQGVEASAEVQVAARKVAEENKKLRDLLKEHGFSDEYITRYIQSGQSTSIAGGPDRSGDSSAAVHSLQQVIAPRRLASFDSNSPFMLPSQMMPSSSTASAANMQASSSWDRMSSCETSSTYSQQQDNQLEMAGQDTNIYPATMFATGSMQTGSGAYTTQPPAASYGQFSRVYAAGPSTAASSGQPATFGEGSSDGYSQNQNVNYGHPPGYL